MEEKEKKEMTEETMMGAARDETVMDNGSPFRETDRDEMSRELETARTRVEQLERERWLLLKGVPEEDLDYCVFRIGKSVTEDKGFEEAAEEFLKERARRESRRGEEFFRSGASLGARGARTSLSTNETMNRLIRGQ